MANIDELAKAVVEKVLQDIERIAETGQLDGMEETERFDSVGGICEFLRGWYGLPPAN